MRRSVWIVVGCLLFVAFGRMTEKGKELAAEGAADSEDNEPTVAESNENPPENAETSKDIEHPHEDVDDEGETETEEEERAHEIVPVLSNDRLGDASFGGDQVAQHNIQRAVEDFALRRLREEHHTVPVQCRQQHHTQVAHFHSSRRLHVPYKYCQRCCFG